MLPAVEQVINEDFLDETMVRRLEDVRRGYGLRRAADRFRCWIEDTSPDGHAELLPLIQVAGISDCQLSTPLHWEDCRLIGNLYLKEVNSQRAVCRLYEDLAALASGKRNGYIESLSTAFLIAASTENFTAKMFQDLQDDFRRLVESEADDMR